MVKYLNTLLVTLFLCPAMSFALECPASITCEKSGDISSCTLSGDKDVNDYWKIDQYSDAEIIKNVTYKFAQVTAYHSKSAYHDSARCDFFYSADDGNYLQVLSASARDGGIYADDYSAKPNGWVIQNSIATCDLASNLPCPLIVVPNMLPVAELHANLHPAMMANLHIKIDDADLEYADYFWGMYKAIVTPEMAQKYCKNKEAHSTCSISFTASDYMTPNPVDLGTVKFDRTDMTIQEVIPPNLLGFQYQVKQLKPFNAIGFEKVSVK